MGHETKHEYGLGWINQDALYEAVLSRFAKSLGLAKANGNLPPDPFTIAVQSMVTNSSLEAGLAFETQRKVNKTLSNAVGGMHQIILGLADNWQDMGAAEGLVDIRTIDGYVHPRFGKPVVAEVKNRFNTIKSSDEPNMWDKIDNACKVLGGAQGYLFQITPRTPNRYDHPWSPSNRYPREHIRVCDGATAYEIVFEHKTALKELYLALPSIFSDIREENDLESMDSIPSVKHMEELYGLVFPD